MLTYIEIRNFVLIEHLTLDLSTGFTVITGETGSGKSTIIQAIELCLGKKAKSSYIRTGHEHCEITLMLENITPSVNNWLTTKDLQNDNQIVIRRKISIDGKSKIHINDKLCSLQTLRELSLYLIGLQGQRDNLLLLKPEFQQKIIDDFGKLDTDINQIKATFNTWKTTQDEISKLESLSNSQQHQELLSYQINELEQIISPEDDVQKIENRHTILSNHDQVQDNLQQAMQILDSDDSIYSNLKTLNKLLSDLKLPNATTSSLQQPIQQVQINLEELSLQIQNIQDDNHYDAQEFNELELKLRTLYDLSCKHNCKIQQLPKLLETMKNELDGLSDKNIRLDELKRESAKIQQQYLALAKKLSKKRKACSNKLDTIVTNQIQTIGMENGEFKTHISSDTTTLPKPGGIDTIEFKIKLNRGHPLNSLRKCASGGELSRISLALQVSTQNSFEIPTFIFDEIDVGISGSTGSLIGKLLKKLGQDKQVICITHSAQVAAFCNNHVKVSKNNDADKATTKIHLLSPNGKVQELSRMLGGIKTAKTSNLAAQALMDEASTLQ